MWGCAFLLAVALNPLSPFVVDREHSVCILQFGVSYVPWAHPDTDVHFQRSFKQGAGMFCCAVAAG